MVDARQSGEWEITNTFEVTSYSKYQGMTLGYRVFIIQQGSIFTATGEKCWEDGVPASSQGKSPIRLEGTIEGNRIVAIFTEEGARRTTTGSFEWWISDDHNTMRGTFKHTAASSSGRTVCERMQ